MKPFGSKLPGPFVCAISESPNEPIWLEIALSLAAATMTAMPVVAAMPAVPEPVSDIWIVGIPVAEAEPIVRVIPTADIIDRHAPNFLAQLI